MLSHAIPEFRLPKAILDWEIDRLTAMGVEIICNVIIGKTLTLDDLFSKRGYAAVFIGTGAATVILAAGAGKRAAQAIHKALAPRN